MASDLAISSSQPTSSVAARDQQLQAAFQDAVAGMFFGQMLKAMRQTVGKPAYIHGGQAEEMFQAQLDQTLAEDLAKGHGGAFVDELYRQFRVQLQLPTTPPPSLQPELPLPALRQAQPEQASQLAEAVRQAQSAARVAEITTGAAGLSALVRK